MQVYIGVVEDRVDPEYLGRVKVRVFGIHTENKNKIPTDSLPWAQVVMPVNSASLGGIGDSATGILPGSWVALVFLDGDNKQQPLILGTVPGEASPPNSNIGFSDPAGQWPTRFEEPDTPYAAMEHYYDQHGSYITKVDTRVANVETAVPPKVTTVALDEADSYYTRQTWNSPNIHQNSDGDPGTPLYPYNKVKETESGHVFEIDDTPGNERISEFHRSGTTYEIQQDGTKTTTVVGSNYTVVFGSDNIYIKGNANITVDGNFRHLVKGNYHLEVNGNKTELIRGSRQTKVGLNENLEIGQDFASNVTENYIQRVGGSETRLVDGLRETTIGLDEDLTVSGNQGTVVLGQTDIFSSGNYSLTTTGALNVTSSGNITVETESSLIENVDVNLNTTIGGNITETAVNVSQTYTSITETATSGNVTYTGGEITVGGITHTQHTHPYTAGIDPEGDGPPVG